MKVGERGAARHLFPLLFPLLLLLPLRACDAGSGNGRAAGEPSGAQPPAPGSAPDSTPSAADSLAAVLDDPAWTVEPTEVASRAGRSVIINTVRAAGNAEWDRVVWEFVGDSLPGYHIEHAGLPVRQCGSGRELQVAGDIGLSIRFYPARGHDDGGSSTLSEDERADLLLLPIVRELRQTCDFEAVAEWVLGLAAPRPYRVLELADPSRLVVDVHH